MVEKRVSQSFQEEAQKYFVQPKVARVDMSGKGNILDTIADNVPFLDSNKGKKIKKAVLDSYAFTPETRKTLGKTEVTYGNAPWGTYGTEQPFINADYIPWARTLAEKATKAGIKIPDSINKFLATPAGDRRLVKINTGDVSTAGHEFFHSSLEGAGFDTQEFNKAWDQTWKEGGDWTEEQKFVDKLLKADPTYSRMNADQKANERFAFIGQLRGAGGLDAIPLSLQYFYKDILSPTMKTSQLAQEAQTAKENADYLNSPMGQTGLVVKDLMQKVVLGAKGAVQEVGKIGEDPLREGKKLVNFLTQSEQKFGEDLGKSLYLKTGGQKTIDDITQQRINIGAQLITASNKETDPARKKMLLERAAESFKSSGLASDEIIGKIKSNLEYIGDAAGVLIDILAFGTYGKEATAGMKSFQLEKTLPSVAKPVVSNVAKEEATKELEKTAVKAPVESTKTLSKDLLDEIYDESVEGMQKLYEGSEKLMKDGVLNPGIMQGRVQDVVLKLKMAGYDQLADNFAEQMAGKTFNNYNELKSAVEYIFKGYAKSGSAIPFSAAGKMGTGESKSIEEFLNSAILKHLQ